jgi:hypothetical protein
MGTAGRWRGAECQRHQERFDASHLKFYDLSARGLRESAVPSPGPRLLPASSIRPQKLVRGASLPHGPGERRQQANWDLATLSKTLAAGNKRRHGASAMY